MFFTQKLFCTQAYDILFFMYVFYSTGRFDMLQSKLNMIGDFTSAFDTDDKQYQLLLECAKLHSETLE